MVTKSGELKTYYQRSWEDFQPYVSGDTWSTTTHVAGLVLPIIGLLHQRAGQAISYASNALNLFSTGKELLTAKKITWSRGYAHVWSIVKSGAEVIGTVASLRIGLAVHAAMNLGESFYALPDFDTPLTSDCSEKVIRVVSNALYLLTLVNFSNPVTYGFIFASLMLQIVSSFKKACDAYEKATSWKEMKILDAAAHTAMMLIYLTKVPFALKLSQIFPKTFVLMQSASQYHKMNIEKGLSQIDKVTGESIVPAALTQIAEQNRKKIMFYASSATHPDLTLNLHIHELAGHFQQLPSGLFTLPSIQRKDLQKRLQNYQEKQEQLGYIPPQIGSKNFPIEGCSREKCSFGAEQSIESRSQVASCIDAAIRQVLAEDTKETELPVFAINGGDIKAYLENEIRKNPEIPENMARNIEDGSMRVVTMTPDDLGDLYVSQVVDPNFVSN